MQLVSASSRTSPARHIGELMGTSPQSEQMMFYSGVAKTKKTWALRGIEGAF